MEELQARHRKEQLDLQSRTRQKKKQASKKSRKAVHDECERLETELERRHARELAILQGEEPAEQDEWDLPLDDLTLSVDDETEKEKEKKEKEGDRVEAGKQMNPLTKSWLANKQPNTSVSLDHQGNKPATKKRNRQKDRLARRAAEQEQLAQAAKDEANSLPDLQAEERARFQTAMQQHQLLEKEIRADGHCLYSAIADQLEQLSIPLEPGHNTCSSERNLPPYKSVRVQAAAYISAHADAFTPFLEEPLESYVHKVRDTGEWGGQVELLALAQTYQVDIHVLRASGRIDRILGRSDPKENSILWLAYYQHSFGLGEHYNSLRRATVMVR